MTEAELAAIAAAHTRTTYPEGIDHGWCACEAAWACPIPALVDEVRRLHALVQDTGLADRVMADAESCICGAIKLGPQGWAAWTGEEDADD